MNLTSIAYRSHTLPALAKSSVGIGVPFYPRGHEHASVCMRVFLCPYHACYGGAFGEHSCSPSLGAVTPTRAPCHPNEIGVSCVAVNLSSKEALMPINTPQIRLINGKPVTTSRDVAECFSKNHRDVTRKIESLDCSEKFRTVNFCAVQFEHNGNQYTEYQITRDGFTFLAMGFTGKRAAQFKEAYINAFNELERQASAPALPAPITDIEKYQLINAMIPSMGFNSSPVVVPYAEMMKLIRVVRGYQAIAEQFNRWPVETNASIERIKAATGFHFGDEGVSHVKC